MTVPTFFGRKLREARLNSGLSLRDLAEKLGVTHVFLGEVERGVKSRLNETHWNALIKALPDLKKEELEDWSKRSQTLELDLRQQSEEFQDLTLVLARAIQTKKDIPERDRMKIMRLLGEGDGK